MKPYYPTPADHYLTLLAPNPSPTLDESYQADAAAQLQSDWSSQLAEQTQELEKARLLAVMTAETTGQRAWQEALQLQEDELQRVQEMVDRAKVALEEAKMNVAEAKMKERDWESRKDSKVKEKEEDRHPVPPPPPPPSHSRVQEQWREPLTDDQTAAMEALDRKHALGANITPSHNTHPRNALFQYALFIHTLNSPYPYLLSHPLPPFPLIFNLCSFLPG